MTRTGTTVKSLKNDVRSVISGSNLGIITPPLINFIMEIPTVITRNTTARATDKADVYLNESATTKRRYIRSPQQCTSNIIRLLKNDNHRETHMHKKKKTVEVQDTLNFWYNYSNHPNVTIPCNLRSSKPLDLFYVPPEAGINYQIRRKYKAVRLQILFCHKYNSSPIVSIKHQRLLDLTIVQLRWKIKNQMEHPDRADR